MKSIRIPKECIERWNGTHRTTTQKGTAGNLAVSLQLHRTEDVLLLSKEFLAWAGSSIPNSEIVAVYVSGEPDTFEVQGSDDDIMLVRMKWYKGQVVPPHEELPENLYVTAPYFYHAEQTNVPPTFQLVR